MSKQSTQLTVSRKRINASYWEPTAAASRNKVVVVAYGSLAMNPPFGAMIEAFCEALCKDGYLVVLPGYFETTGTKPNLLAVAASDATFNTWIACLSAASKWGRTKAKNGALGLVGFSLGSNLVLKAALAFPVAAVVDYYGPIDVLPDLGKHRLTEARVAKLPRTLIHHGKQDRLVSLQQSQTLKAWLTKGNVPHEAYFDYDCGHPGDLEAPPWSASAETLALGRTITFLNASL